MPYVIVATMATLGFFLILNVFIENPFERYWLVPGQTQPVSALFRPAGNAEVFTRRTAPATRCCATWGWSSTRRCCIRHTGFVIRLRLRSRRWQPGSLARVDPRDAFVGVGGVAVPQPGAAARRALGV